MIFVVLFWIQFLGFSDLITRKSIDRPPNSLITVFKSRLVVLALNTILVLLVSTVFKRLNDDCYWQLDKLCDLLKSAAGKVKFQKCLSVGDIFLNKGKNINFREALCRRGDYQKYIPNLILAGFNQSLASDASNSFHFSLNFHLKFRIVERVWISDVPGSLSEKMAEYLIFYLEQHRNSDSIRS